MVEDIPGEGPRPSEQGALEQPSRWEDQDLVDRSRGDLDYYILLVQAAQAKDEYESYIAGAQGVATEAEVSNHQGYVQEMQTAVDEYASAHGYYSQPPTEGQN